MQIPAGTVAGVYGYHRGWASATSSVSDSTGSWAATSARPNPAHVIQVFGLPNMRSVLHCLPTRDWAEPGSVILGMIYTAMPVTDAVPAVAGHRDAQ